jgi:hypothetical protein
VLFDGTVNEMKNVKLTKDGLIEARGMTAFDVRDFQLHAEFKAPYKPAGRGQDRGNCGIYIQQRYEIQILDSFGLDGRNNECGAIYQQAPPDVNMCLPPLAWQTYDIWFTAAKFQDGKKSANARISVWHNGVPIHVDREVVNKTGAGQVEGPQALPIRLAEHGNPVHFRNLWIVLGRPIHPEPPAPPMTLEPCECCLGNCQPGLLGRHFGR